MLRHKNGVIRFPKLYIQPINGMGLGVFADRRIRKGEVIERCPVLPLIKYRMGQDATEESMVAEMSKG